MVLCYLFSQPWLSCLYLSTFEVKAGTCWLSSLHHPSVVGVQYSFLMALSPPPPRFRALIFLGETERDFFSAPSSIHIFSSQQAKRSPTNKYNSRTHRGKALQPIQSLLSLAHMTSREIGWTYLVTTMVLEYVLKVVSRTWFISVCGIFVLLENGRLESLPKMLIQAYTLVPQKKAK